MKDIVTYISENLEDKHTWLISTYEEAHKYFEKYPKILKGLGLVDKDIENLYKIKDNNNIDSAPIVGNYGSNGGSKTGIIAFRRWVEYYIDDWSKSNNVITPEWYWTKIKGIYAGPHNTNLEKGSVYVPSAEDWEFIISGGFNGISEYKEKFDIKSLEEGIKYATGNNKEKAEKLIKYINTTENNKVVMQVIEKCNKALQEGIKKEGFEYPFKKCDNEEIDSRWVKAGGYDKTIKSVPKTDIMTDNGIRISLKKHGGSQLTSASYNDTKAMFLLCAKDERSKLTKDEINEIETALSKKWIDRTKVKGGVKKNSDNPTIKYGYELTKKLNDIFNKYLGDNADKKYDDFKYSVLWECITGDKKFGKDSNASAHYVLEWTDKSNENAKLYKIKEYINSIKDNVRYKFTYKSADNTAYQAFRIINSK